jgi:hypothetical protein
MRFLIAAAMLLVVCAPAWAITVTTEETGEIAFLKARQSFSRVVCGAFGPGWAGTSQADAYDRVDSVLLPERRELRATLDIPATAANTTFEEAAWRQSGQVFAGQYDFTINDTAEFNSLYVSFYLPCDLYAGRTVTAYDSGNQVLQSVPLPATLADTQLLSQSGVARIEVALGGDIGYEITLSFANVQLQDNRTWGGNDFELRINLLGAYSGSPVPAGTQFSCPFSVAFSESVDFQLDPNTATSRTDTTGWVPFVMPWDVAPLDLSWLNEKPAGTHGFLTVRDGRFVFEDEAEARFWGVCVSAGANFPTHEQSEKIAERIAKFGVNMVRTHHADAGWSRPNFFDESHGDTQHFDADALDRFDYFLYCLKQQGIYVYLDQLVHRKFTEGDGVMNANELDHAAKPYTIFDPTLIALQKQFSCDLWPHVNPYTGLAYTDDPAIALMEFTNENDILSFDVTVEPYATNLEQMWQAWAAAHSVDPNQPVRLVGERSSDVLQFMDELQQRYYADMYSYLRGIGVRVPITGNTWLVRGANLPSQATMDYMDAHAYWDHPYDDYSRWHNRAQVHVDPNGQGNNFACLSMSRVHGMPYVCSEWGHPWPNEWRAEGCLPTAAVAALQGWDGVLAYTYRHNCDVPVDRISGAFDVFNDPAVFGLFPASALMFRRGDVAHSVPPTAVRWSDSDIFGLPQLSAWGGQPSYRSLVEETSVVTALSTPSGGKAVVAPADFPGTAGPTHTESDTGQLRRDWRQGVGTIDSPRSQAAYGFLGAAGQIDLTDVSLTVSNDFAAIAVTSLDGEPISASAHLLVTAVGRAENTGMVYNLTHTTLRESGSGPILVEPITGQVTIRNANAGLAVYAVGPDGSRTTLGAPAVSEEGMTLDLNAAAATIFYEIKETGVPD